MSSTWWLFIDWNEVRAYTSTFEAGKLFIDLLLRSSKKKNREAMSTIGRANITVLKHVHRLGDDAEVSEQDMFSALKDWIDAINSAQEDDDSPSEKVSYYNKDHLAPEIEGPIVRWEGSRTRGRFVEVQFDKERTNDREMTAIRFTTGTGKPSRFLAAFCRLTARNMMEEAKRIVAAVE